MNLIPHQLFQVPEFQKFQYNESSGFLFKSISRERLDQDNYISANVVSIVLKGEQIIQPNDEPFLVIRPGEMGILSRGLYTVSDFLTTDAEFSSLLVFFDDQLVQEFLSELPRSQAIITPGPEFLKAHLDPSLQLFREGVLQLFRTQTQLPSDLVRLKIKEFLHLLLLLDLDGKFSRLLLSIGRKKQRNLPTFMSQNFDKPLKVEDYAFLSGRSLSSFRRDFKKAFQVTPQQWLKDKRLEKGRELLAELKLSVTQVALEVGYENVSWFIREFKKKFELTPKQFAAQKREELMAG